MLSLLAIMCSLHLANAPPAFQNSLISEDRSTITQASQMAIVSELLIIFLIPSDSGKPYYYGIALVGVASSSSKAIHVKTPSKIRIIKTLYI